MRIPEAKFDPPQLAGAACRRTVVAVAENYLCAGGELLGQFQQIYSDRFGECLDILRRVRFFPGKTRVTLSPELVVRYATPPLTDWGFLDPRNNIDPLGPETLAFVRTVVDFSSGLPEVPWTDLPISSAHGLVVGWKPGERIAVQLTAGRAEVTGRNFEKVSGKIMDLVLDVILDINMFYRSDFLPGMYSALHSRRHFDDEKKAFVRHYTGEPCLTIASGCRCSRGLLDVEKYEHLWRHFVDSWLMPGVLAVPEENGVILTDWVEISDRLTSRLSAYPKLLGQFSIKKTGRKIARLQSEQTSRGCSGFSRVLVAVSVKTPATEAERHRILALFKRTKWHLKQTACFPLSELPSFADLAPYVQLIVIDLAREAGGPKGNLANLDPRDPVP
ncbi:hypothetical protein [Luteolibacter luteus]|uniref:Uncharacterized protein n=1 Tax=Luteolibacter luteus TaxID=2728835 RepID=A0A858RQD6_9BACT|nr:hypothetical protein [Luteolibacter luteus]QJE98945.1 hypothetical protein HHL09_25250 [Luteolibacter luteus]